MRYLVLEEKLETDYSTLVPHYSKPYIIPSVYSIDEIKRIEKTVDTSTKQGKRDYAIILLASRMGLRSGDIVKLKIEDIKGKNEINIIQQKTRKALHLPLIEEVSVAIDDYLSVRPSSKAKEIFINVYAPYNPISTGTIRNLLEKYILRKEELSSEAYRHYKHTVMLFDDYLHSISLSKKSIDESVIEDWIKKISDGISINTVGGHIFTISGNYFYS